MPRNHPFSDCCRRGLFVALVEAGRNLSRPCREPRHSFLLYDSSGTGGIHPVREPVQVFLCGLCAHSASRSAFWTPVKSRGLRHRRCLCGDGVAGSQIPDEFAGCVSCIPDGPAGPNGAGRLFLPASSPVSCHPEQKPLCVDRLVAFQPGKSLDGFPGLLLGEPQVIEAL